MFEIFNTREIALFFWSIIILTWILSKMESWGSFKKVLSTFFSDKIITPILLSIIYAETIILILALFDYWDLKFLKDTLFWFIGSAIISIFNANKATENPDYFKKNILDNIKFIIVFEFIINFYTLPLFWEIILIPFLLIISLADKIFQDRKEIATKKFTTGILTIFGIFLLSFSITNLVKNFEAFASLNTLKIFLLPIILTVLFIPFTYLLAVYMKYENMFIFVGFRFKNKQQEFNKIKWRIFKFCLFNLNKQIKLRRLQSFSYIMSLDDLNKTINEYKSPVANNG
ncbi:hypothetical protein G3I01_14650 [Gramella sp. MT6]|uniref:hypothetical protein n=1 Tax=Gramella sp. MT6 TaxID=2705471 RepID=UPI001C5FF544|nr:hypothetical protein [Gramella sp. MT6]QYA26683.1 hypothetical protein G3I01_14650 [Gramella sp. MT6]